MKLFPDTRIRRTSALRFRKKKKRKNEMRLGIYNLLAGSTMKISHRTKKKRKQSYIRDYIKIQIHKMSRFRLSRRVNSVQCNQDS